MIDSTYYQDVTTKSQATIHRHVPIRMLVRLLALCIAANIHAPTALAAKSSSEILTDELRSQCITELRNDLENGKKWVKVHAAEALLEQGYPQNVDEVFKDELSKFGSEPEYRIGIWRVLARATHDPLIRDQYLTQIKEAYLQPNGPDQLHACRKPGQVSICTKVVRAAPIRVATARTE